MVNYMFIVVCNEEKDARDLHTLIYDSKQYHSENFISLGDVEEVCDKCSRKGGRYYG